MAVIGNSPATTGTTVTAQSFNGDASTVAFTLSRSVNSTVDLEVLVDNVQQSPYDSSYSVSGTTLTFSEAPASGTNNIYVIYRGATIATAQVIPDDGSVSTAKLQDTAITSAKLATGVVEGAMTTQFGRRNLIINGAMQVAQRGTSFNLSSADTYTLDRFQYNEMSTYAGAVTVSQDTSAPSGFASSLKVLVTTATSVSGAQGITIRQKVEAQDLQQLAYGTADAKQAVMSFWVKSNVTGTYVVGFNQEDAGRDFTGVYTIDTADTWEYKSFVIPADTSGGIDNNNGVGFEINWVLSSGTDYTSGTLQTTWQDRVLTDRYAGQTADVAGTLNNYWQITGVQLEVGTVATPFEHRSYGEELVLCQRYYEKSYVQGTSPGASPNVYEGAIYFTMAASQHYEEIRYAVEKRAAATVVLYASNDGSTGYWFSHADDSKKTVTSGHGNSAKGVRVTVNGSDGHRMDGHFTADAEL